METNYEKLISKSSTNIPTSFIREILAVSEQSGMISFAGGLPNPTYFPVEQMKNAFVEMMEADGREILQYAESQGYLPLREWICGRYNKKYQMNISPENILITNGSQQALDMLGKLFINPGDPILTESPTYLGAIQAFSAYRPEFHQVQLRNNGIDLNQLEDVILKTGARILYSIPNFQNPTGISYSSEIRKELAILLDWYEMMLIEDDPYNEIRFEGDFLPPVYALNPERTVWCGSFSKMISPGIRAGWICAPKELIPYLLKIKQAADLHTNNVVQRLIYKFLTDYDPDEHLQKVKEVYKVQKDCMIAAIQRHFPEEISYTNPQGGMFIWASLPHNIDATILIRWFSSPEAHFIPRL